MRRIVFMGTPDFAVPGLETLLSLPGTSVVGVYTQPDRPAGRGSRVQASPVKQVALRAGIPVYQPLGFRKRVENVETLRDLRPDLLVVAAYGLILPPSVLQIPPLGSINVHASLLPRWRGAAPITFALLEGDAVTGVTIMLMDEGMDTGPILMLAEEPIRADDTTASLGARLARLGAATLQAALPRWVAGDLTPIPQPEAGVTYARLVKKQDGAIDWARPAVVIERAVRAYQPWPTAFTRWRGEPLKILKAAALSGVGTPGTVVAVSGGVAVATGEGLLRLDEVQPAGRRPMPGKAFVNGAPGFVGSMLPG